MPQLQVNFLPYTFIYHMYLSLSKHLGFGSRSFLWSFILRPRWSFPKTPCEVHWKFVGVESPSIFGPFFPDSVLPARWSLCDSFRSFRKIRFRNSDHTNFQDWISSLKPMIQWQSTTVRLLDWPLMAHLGGKLGFLGLLNTPQWSLNQKCSNRSCQKNAKKDQTWNGDTISQS